MQVLSLDGRVLGKSVTGDLFFPNRLRLAGDSLMVADNDHRRLVWLDIRQELAQLSRCAKACRPALTRKR